MIRYIAGPMTAGIYVYTDEPTRKILFFYNADGLRTGKQTLLGGKVIETTDYTLHGKLVTEMRRDNDVLHFFYDAQSRPTMVKWNGQMYTYVHNLQGDIVAIVDSSGAKVVEYRYDAWGRDIGRTLTSDIGELNPFRYRGYVYDEETGLYYLRSRYYSAGMGRFVCEDNLIRCKKRFEYSSFAYCWPSPMTAIDKNGNDAVFITDTSGLTHSSLLIQDENGYWYYFYWGASKEGSSSSKANMASNSGFSAGQGNVCVIYNRIDLIIDESTDEQEIVALLPF